MKFEELPEETKDCARAALCSLLVKACPEGAEQAKSVGEHVAAAFIALERHDSDPDACGDGSIPEDGNQLLLD